MSEWPFSSEIKPFKKPLELGNTNNIYYDPKYPDVLIRVPIDIEARFLKSDPLLIKVAEKHYNRLREMGKNLNINIAQHQFIVAKETKEGPIKPMLLAKRIEGDHLVPIDKNNGRVLDAIDRIVQLGRKYMYWIESNRPKLVVTDIFRPEQFIVQSKEKYSPLYLVDIEPRLKEREEALRFIRWQLMMLVGPLRYTEHNNTFLEMMRDALRHLKRNPNDGALAGLVGLIVNCPEAYEQMSDDILNDREIRDLSDDVKKRVKNTPLTIDQVFLRRLGIEKI